ncbi:hypothetical protein [Parasitella parasitica]|uniref:G-patch domain-containing protein n=1 Tax=Parasitella parasitica TaxID=35722 RepID=A0A0B7N3P2_9FUNG|nr:hypothetical protein [Parasitella parasitica]
MARFKGSKSKRKEKRHRGSGFGFSRSKVIEEFEGNTPEHGHLNALPVAQHTMHEEVFVVDSVTVRSPQKLSSFDQLGRISMTQLTNSIPDTETLDDSTEELGFFFDSTPPQPVESQTALKAKSNTLQARASNSSYKEKRSKIIQDDSVYIDSEDDGIDTDSISSSENVDILNALAHWNRNEILQVESAGQQHLCDEDDDYAMLMSTSVSDICGPDHDVIEMLSSDEYPMPFKSPKNQEMYVPDSMKHSYRGLLEEDRSRLKKQAKLQRKKRKIDRITQDLSVFKSAAKSGYKNIFDQVAQEFLQKDNLKNYRLSNLSYHGRRIVVPKLAKMFNLDISLVNSSKSCIDLIKTKKTYSSNDYKKLPIHNAIMKQQNKSKVEKSRTKQDKNHGKQVALNSTPISTNNVGHRMLAAMGWKEGEAIGNNEDGIKEPVKVFMRAKQRGLGA